LNGKQRKSRGQRGGKKKGKGWRKGPRGKTVVLLIVKGDIHYLPGEKKKVDTVLRKHGTRRDG